MTKWYRARFKCSGSIAWSYKAKGKYSWVSLLVAQLDVVPMLTVYWTRKSAIILLMSSSRMYIWAFFSRDLRWSFLRCCTRDCI